MARITQRLTAVAVATLKIRGLHADGDGLYLRITPSGTKSWIFRFAQGGATRDMGLGPFPSISLARAREMATEVRRQHLNGADPIATRNTRRTAAKIAAARETTFRSCAEALIASHEVSWRNSKHRQQWRNTITTYAYPLLGHLAVGAIDTDLVLRTLEPIWSTKPETASRVRGRIEAVLNWAKARGLRDGQNPAQWRGHLDQLLPARSKVRRTRHHPSLPHVEMPALMADLRSRTGISARALEFTILTATRTGEALGARWDEIDLKQRIWIVPADRMKSGREHRVPLSSRAVIILSEMAEIRLNEFVFPGIKLGRPLSNMSLLMLLRNVRPGIVTHGFRSSFKDWASETTSFPDHVSEAALAHASADKVRAAYARSDLSGWRRKLMEAWAGYCSRILVEGEVIPLRRGTT